MPTVLRHSGELIQCLETSELPGNCFLVTVDVSPLNPNIDTNKAKRGQGGPDSTLASVHPTYLRIILSDGKL